MPNGIRYSLQRVSKATRYFRLLGSIGSGCDPNLGPSEVMVDFSNRCNLHCLCCFSYSPLGPCRFHQDEMQRSFSSELFIQLLDDCASLGVETINLAGSGEPLMHPDCGRLVGEMLKRGLRATMATNGTLLPRYPEVCRLLSTAVVSLQAGTAEGYARMHPKDQAENWQRSLHGLRLLREASVPTIITLVLCSENYRDLDAAIDLAGSFNANLYVKPLLPFIRLREGEREVDPDQTDKLQLSDEHLEEMFRRRAEYVHRANAWNIQVHGLAEILHMARTGEAGAPTERLKERVLSIYDQQPCYVGWYFTRVQMDGTVTPCCQCLGGINLGNIRERSFSEIWRSPEYAWFRDVTLRPPLRDSEIRDFCDCGLCDCLSRNIRVQRYLTGSLPIAGLVRLAQPLLQRRRNTQPSRPVLNALTKAPDPASGPST